jgi:tricarballylate dehydrogenase
MQYFAGFWLRGMWRVGAGAEVPAPGRGWSRQLGELVGGLFHFNHPGGTGLMSGAAFGKIAGTSDGRRAKQEQV